MRAYKRLLRYAAIDTQSNEDNAAVTPSTEKQYAFSWLLHCELQDLGMKQVYTDPHAYTYAFLPASPGWESEPVIGLIAHIDTAPDFSGTGVKPQTHFDYDGGDNHDRRHHAPGRGRQGGRCRDHDRVRNAHPF